MSLVTGAMKRPKVCRIPNENMTMTVAAPST
jgi:hypothetical protein